MSTASPASAPAARPLFDAIRPGSRVTFSTQHGSMLTGRCVMKFQAHAVLNLGGRHGTPGVVTPDTVHKVVNKESKG